MDAAILDDGTIIILEEKFHAIRFEDDDSIINLKCNCVPERDILKISSNGR
jgi:hypothetical protein